MKKGGGQPPFDALARTLQNVESYWNRVKIKLKKMKGCHSQHLPGYLDEFMWRERYGTTAAEAFENIVRDIAFQYPV
jgi:transposase-like protein